MRRDEAWGIGRLLGLTLRGSTRRAAELHEGIADRAFGAIGPRVAPVRRLHDVIAGLAYSGVGLALDAGSRLGGAAASLGANGRGLDDDPAGRFALAVLNGAHGDVLARSAPGLATPLGIRVDGRPVAAEPDALAAAFPDATDRLAVFVHGLTETERAWCYRAAREPETYGTRLRRDLGLTPVYLRYNTGRHISDNGRDLDALLGALVAAWPAEVQDVVLIGHSMGGLVARSALHQAGGGTPGASAWTHLVRDTVTLGTPHLGAPLERGVHRLTHTLARLPETVPLSRLLAARSVGIKDLRRGTLVEADWAGRDLDAAGTAAHTHVPLADGARHFVVLGTLARDPEGRLADLLGDLMVSPRSALGDTGGDDRLAFPADAVARLGGLNHLDLLNHPRVYARLRDWLEHRPEGPQPAAGD